MAAAATKPIVLSYDSSPAFTVGEDGTSTTSALLDTCFRQVEYAGILDGAANTDGAQALVDFLLGSEVQTALPESMYVFPVVDGTELPGRLGRARGAADRPVLGRPGRGRGQPRGLAPRVDRPHQPLRRVTA